MSDRVPKARIQEILKSIPNPTVVELGAHRGTDTEWLYEAAAYRGQVAYLAVEPDHRHWEALAAVADPRGIRSFFGAIGAEIGYALLNLSLPNWPDVPASSSLREPKAHLDCFPNCYFEKAPNPICVMTLDGLMRAYGLQPDFIWTDIQGSEGDMIAGGRETLRKTKWVYSESYDCEMYTGQILRPEFLRQMGELGFEVEDSDRDNVLLRNRNV